MVSFEDLTLEKWLEFKEDILNSEMVFPERIRGSEEDFLQVLSIEGTIAKIMKLNNRYIGNMIGCDTAHAKREWPDIPDIAEKSIYVYNIVIDSPYQGRGHGRRLLEEFITEVRDKDYKLLVGHFRPNNSLPLIINIGGEEISIHKDWSGTGEDYVYCELRI